MNKVCKGCKKKILEPSYGLLKGKAYHLAEFICVCCKKSLSNLEAIEDEGTGCLYCEDCHQLNIEKRCDTCKAIILGTAFEALDKYYHPHHF